MDSRKLFDILMTIMITKMMLEMIVLILLALLIRKLNQHNCDDDIKSNWLILKVKERR